MTKPADELKRHDDKTEEDLKLAKETLEDLDPDALSDEIMGGRDVICTQTSGKSPNSC